MSLAATFATVRPAVVAFTTTFAPAQPDGKRPPLFPIIGTGFILDDGFVITNAHVIDALLSIPRPPDFPKERWPFTAVLFHYIDRQQFPKAPVDGYAEIPLEVLGVFRVGDLMITGEGFYYGPRKPDFNIVHVKAKGLPRVELLTDTGVLAEGTEVGTIGFPMGTKALSAPGWVHQFGPFLQRGVISAVLPFPCKSPHSFVINVMSMGGASGSPVFLADKPKVVGILNAGLMDTLPTVGAVEGKIGQTGIVQAHTNFSYVVPSFFLGDPLEKIKADATFKLPDDALSIAEMIERASFVVGKQPGHNEPPDPRRMFVEPESSPRIEVRIEPTARE
jgi:Trypsin-like peptidase domain